jgi:signal transduction histidine kinase
VLSVRNDGPTLSADWTLDDADGVGVRNVRQRLEASIGTPARVTIANAPDGSGVEATVTLPYRTA